MAHCRFVEVKCFISQLEKKINMRFDRVSLNGTVFTKVNTNVEVATRGQSSNKIWYTFRAGRITASMMKSVIQTDHTMPSQSLIKRICYPEAFKFSTTATR